MKNFGQFESILGAFGTTLREQSASGRRISLRPPVAMNSPFSFCPSFSSAIDCCAALSASNSAQPERGSDIIAPGRRARAHPFLRPTAMLPPSFPEGTLPVKNQFASDCDCLDFTCFRIKMNML